MLSEAAKKAKREYMRAWRKKNKDRVKELEKRFWENRAKEAEEAEEPQENAVEQGLNEDIKAALKQAGVRQYEVAGHLGVSAATFSRLLKQKIPKRRRKEIINAIRLIESMTHFCIGSNLSLVKGSEGE